MARARNLKPGFFSNPELAELPFEDRLLFAGLWTLADREGRLEDRVSKIKMQVFPADNIDCEAGLARLAAKGLILRYEVDGLRLIDVINFLKHQNPHKAERPSVLPPPPSKSHSVIKTAQSINDSDAAACEHDASTVQTLCEHAARPAESLDLIPDPGFLTPDSVVANATTKPAGQNIVHFVQKASQAVDNHALAVQKPVEQKTANDVRYVFEYWKKRLFHDEAKLGDRTPGRIEAALGWGYTPDDLCQAVDGCANSPFHMGVNDTRTVHDGLKIILRDSEQIAKFITLAKGVMEVAPKKPCAVHPQSGLTDWGTCWGCYSQTHSAGAGD